MFIDPLSPPVVCTPHKGQLHEDLKKENNGQYWKDDGDEVDDDGDGVSGDADRFA